MLVVDIETGAKPKEQIKQFCPEFVPPQHPGEFNPANVKTGNLKDPAKIAEKIKVAELSHAEALQNYAQTVEAALAEHEQKFYDDAALDAATCEILAIGYCDVTTGKAMVVSQSDELDESLMLTKFWEQYNQCLKNSRHIIGLNLLGFDIPMIVRRSWMLMVDVPANVRKDRRYWNPIFIDLRDSWLLGQSSGQTKWSLDHIALSLGLSGKTKGEIDGIEISGKNFGKLFHGTPEQQAKALEYAKQDVLVTAEITRRLGLV